MITLIMYIYWLIDRQKYCNVKLNFVKDFDKLMYVVKGPDFKFTLKIDLIIGIIILAILIVIFIKACCKEYKEIRNEDPSSENER